MLKKIPVIWIVILVVSIGWFMGGDDNFVHKLYAQAKPDVKAQRSSEMSYKSKASDFYGQGLPRLFGYERYGNVVLDRYSSKKKFKPVVFPHWIHRVKYTCKVCHSDLEFQMKQGADDIKMAEIFQGKWCGACHNGKISFAPADIKGANCQRCHSYGTTVADKKDPKIYLKGIPSYAFGNKVNWIKAVEEKHISPKASLDGKIKMFVFDKNIEFPVPKGMPPNVIFPHKAHTEWLHCNSCHPRVFVMKQGVNKFTMTDLFQGRYCGVCHGSVAFPFEDCFRCHSKVSSENIKQVSSPKTLINAAE